MSIAHAPGGSLGCLQVNTGPASPTLLGHDHAARTGARDAITVGANGSAANRGEAMSGGLRMGDAPNPYDRVAGIYWAAQRMWLACSGGSAQARLLSYLAEVLRSGDRLLEVGAGTGLLTRRIQSSQPAAIVSVLDLSTAMLARAPITVAERIVGSVLALPVPDCSYDLVVAGWVIETTGAARHALSECARVLRPGGHLLCCHAAQLTTCWDGSRLSRPATSCGGGSAVVLWPRPATRCRRTWS